MAEHCSKLAIKTLRLYQYLWWELWTAFNLFFWRFSFEVTLLYFALDNYFFCSVFFNIDLSCCWLSVFLFIISFHIDKVSEKKRNIYDFKYILVSIPSCTKGSYPPFFGFPFFLLWNLGDSIACTILNEQRRWDKVSNNWVHGEYFCCHKNIHILPFPQILHISSTHSSPFQEQENPFIFVFNHACWTYTDKTFDPPITPKIQFEWFQIV